MFVVFCEAVLNYERKDTCQNAVESHTFQDLFVVSVTLLH